jgi:hypothetical protein
LRPSHPFPFKALLHIIKSRDIDIFWIRSKNLHCHYLAIVKILSLSNKSHGTVTNGTHEFIVSSACAESLANGRMTFLSS